MDFIEEAKKTSVRAHGEIVARVIIDTSTKQILFVPADINHPEFLSAYLKTQIHELEENPELISHFVGAAIKIADDKVNELLVGISGTETTFTKYKSPLHTKQQVNKARDIILSVLQDHNLLSEHFKLKMIYL